MNEWKIKKELNPLTCLTTITSILLTSSRDSTPSPFLSKISKDATKHNFKKWMSLSNSRMLLAKKILSATLNKGVENWCVPLSFCSVVPPKVTPINARYSWISISLKIQELCLSQRIKEKGNDIKDRKLNGWLETQKIDKENILIFVSIKCIENLIA